MGLGGHASAFAPPTATDNGRTNLIGLSRDELTAAVTALGMEAYRAKQIWQWMYKKGVVDFTAMHTIAKKAQQQLAEHFYIYRPTITQHQQSDDGTQKWLLRLAGDQDVEMVHIPEAVRGTLCISSQVGCTLTCKFCHTGTQPLVRNLSSAEMLAQIMYARDALNEWPSDSPRSALNNIVLMGMGEPLYNYENIAKAMHIVMDSDGIAIAKRRITLSTAGVVPLIERCGRELNVNLAISLHAVTDALRDIIMPINKKYPLRDLLNACRNYPGLSNARRITFEYVMLKGVNDSDADARALVELLRGIPAKINLIPFNAWPGAEFECSSNNRINRFGDILSLAGFSSPIRTPRGRDILAACGQLKSASERMRAHRTQTENN